MVSASESTFEILLDRQFGSFEELADITRAFELDFRQVDASCHQQYVLQAQVDGLLVSRARFGCHVDQRGATPKHRRTFALLDESSPQMLWFGHRVGPGALIAFPTHGEIEVFSRPGFSVYTFSLPSDGLAEFFERSGGPALDEVLAPTETVIPVRARHLQDLWHQLRQVSTVAGDPKRFPHLLEGFQWRLYAILLELFRSSAGRWPEPIPPRNRRLLEKAAVLADTQGDSPPGLCELCAAGQVSERTLLNTFKREFGMTPKAYLKGHRLFRVHRELWHADPSRTRVADVANSWGFWHMGQFAGDYRKVFGELPSETLKRSN